MPTPTENLRQLNWSLPPPPEAKGSYAPAVRAGHMVYVAGQGAFRDGAVLYPGVVDREIPIAQAQEAARIATFQALSAVQTLIGSIDRIERIVRVQVFVASSPGFTQQHVVANGATEPLIALFGEAGRPARIAVGVPSLPLNFPVEVELWAQIWSVPG
jgi:enamine deaminase RidA (YjgF/YER057c/UK114 family)